MRSIRMLSAFSARQRSSVSPVRRVYLIPASGLNSNVVTTGPGLICVTCPRTSNSAYFSVSTAASSFSSPASTARCSSGRCNRLLEGSLYPPAMRGIVVFGFTPLSARSLTSGATLSGSGSGGISRTGSDRVIRSMPVTERGVYKADCDCAGAGIRRAVILGLSARRFSILRFARTSCQSLYRFQSATAKTNRVGAHTRTAANENAVERYSATPSTVVQTMYAPATLK